MLCGLAAGGNDILALRVGAVGTILIFTLEEKSEQDVTAFGGWKQSCSDIRSRLGFGDPLRNGSVVPGKRSATGARVPFPAGKAVLDCANSEQDLFLFLPARRIDKGQLGE